MTHKVQMKEKIGMRRTLVFVLVLLVALGSIGGCDIVVIDPVRTETVISSEAEEIDTSSAVDSRGEEENETIVSNDKPVLEICSFTNETETQALVFQQHHPEIDVRFSHYSFTEITDDPYDPLGISSDGLPDILVIEYSQLGEFFSQYDPGENGNTVSLLSEYKLENLDELRPLAEEMGVFPMALDLGTSPDGVLRAIPIQSYPGVMFYRRSLAKEFFGTDEPAEIQEYFSSIEKMQESAEIIKNASDGSVYTIASCEDLIQPFFSSREDPFVVDGEFIPSPWMNDLVNLAKVFADNQYMSPSTQWDTGWFAGMNDTLTDEQGNPKQIFSYLMPGWGLQYLLMEENDPDYLGEDVISTAGDWAAIPGPIPYEWGGTWIGMIENCDHRDAAMEFLEFVTLDGSNLTDWATGVYTNEYLREIDPAIAMDLSQPGGDFISSAKVAESIMEEMGERPEADFLGGQNPYAVYFDVAIELEVIPRRIYDETIQNNVRVVLREYVDGNMTKEEAVTAFLEAVAEDFPGITVDKEACLAMFE